MIIIGYPGIGKSTLATSSDLIEGYKGVIDLESSCFHNKHINARDDFWYVPYCQVAADLSRQGYMVLVSSHENVCRELAKYTVYIKVCYPDLSLKEEWIKKLRCRYLESQVEKDRRAYERAVDYYEEDIKSFTKYGFDKIVIDSMEYKLVDILSVQED